MKHAWSAKFIGMVLVMALGAGCAKEDPQKPAPNPIDDSAEMVQVLANVYRAQDYATFSALLAEDFLFILDEPNPVTGETQWNVATERRIHSRMFDPQNIPPGDPPLPAEDWLQTVSITLTAQEAFVERFDLYTTAMPPGPLDPTRWIARSATYSTDVFFQMPNDRAFQVRGRADFTIIEDRAKQIGDAGKFLILHWEDIGMVGLAVDGATWSGVKGLYN